MEFEVAGYISIDELICLKKQAKICKETFIEAGGYNS
jgi:hypothetical protein